MNLMVLVLTEKCSAIGAGVCEGPFRRKLEKCDGLPKDVSMVALSAPV